MNLDNLNTKIELLARMTGYYYEDDIINKQIIIHKREQEELYCSFCDKSENEVDKLIAGPNSIYICNECVDLCKEIIDEEKVESKDEGDNNGTR